MIYTKDIMGYQWDLLLKAINLGILLGGCYDFFRMIRIVFAFKKRLFIASDFIYCMWAAFLIFSFLLNENFGYPRAYIFLGTAVGFCAWYFTIGRITPKAAKLLKKVIWFIFWPFVKIFRKILKTAKKRIIKAKIFTVKAGGGGKKLLKKKAGLVYNILCLCILKVFPFCGGRTGKEPGKVESNGTEKAQTQSFSSDRSCCLRGLCSVFPDIGADQYQQKTERTDGT